MQQLVDRWNVFRPYYINSDCRNASLHLWACVQLFIQHIRLKGHSFSLIAYVLRGRKGTQRSCPKKKFMNVLKRSQASISEILHFWYLINAGFWKKEKNCRGAPGLNSILTCERPEHDEEGWHDLLERLHVWQHLLRKFCQQFWSGSVLYTFWPLKISF